MEAFFRAAEELIGAEAVVAAADLSGQYGSTTVGLNLDAAGALRPAGVGEVQALVRLAAERGVPLYPVSTGNNWGYGGAAPARPDSVILDLSRLTGIDDRHLDLGVIGVEPGVTQQGLHDYLQARGLDYMVPVHGGGPACSLVGNALERGYGITPHTDHFAAVTALEAILPGGEYYRTPMTEQGAQGVDALFKWGVGPYVDGLFSQGHLGVVVRMWLVLAPRPRRIESFILRLPCEESLPGAVTALREVLASLPGIVHGINLMNARRMLSMMASYPADQLDAAGIVADEHLQRLASRHRVAPWTVLGALYGEPEVVKAARRVLRRRLKDLGARPLFVSPALVERLLGWVGQLPSVLVGRLPAMLETLYKGQRIILGEPAEVALPLAYWKLGGPQRAQGLHPARDGCGILWYAPLVPLRSEVVTAYVDMVHRVCRQYGMEPLITLTTQSDRCVDSTVPLLFDPRREEEVQRARACYGALLEAGRELGCVPYRYPAQEMDRLVEPDSPYWALVRRLSRAADPRGIIAPGRYGG